MTDRETLPAPPPEESADLPQPKLPVRAPRAPRELVEIPPPPSARDPRRD